MPALSNAVGMSAKLASATPDRRAEGVRMSPKFRRRMLLLCGVVNLAVLAHLSHGYTSGGIWLLGLAATCLDLGILIAA